MLFINTRPVTRAQPLSQYLQLHGIAVMDLPLLALVEKPLHADETQVLQAINTYQMVLLVSEDAVTYGLSHLARRVGLSAVSAAVTWVAVGKKTADCFAHTWQSHTKLPPPRVIFPTEARQQNNEGLLQLPVMRKLCPGNQVQIWRGVGGRELVADTLKANGVTVELLDFYQRTLPTSTLDTAQQWQTQGMPDDPMVILISSLAAWQHWCALRQRYALSDKSITYLVLQSRIAQQITHDYRRLPAQPAIKVIHDLQPDTVLHALLP